MDKDIKEQTMEELVNKAVEMKTAIDEIESGLSVIKDELKDRLTALKLTGTVVSNYYISRMKRVSFPDVTMSEAEGYGAIKRTIDSEKLKALFNKGIKIKAKITEYLNIREKKDET